MSVPSIFQIIGPVMVGPSSSHTAGAVRIGQESRKLLGEEPVSINITLYGSYAKGYRGHKTDVAVLGGCLGFATDDPRVRDAKKEAQARDIKVALKLDENTEYHTNTAVVEMVGQSGRKIKVRGISIGGGTAKIEDAQEIYPCQRSINVSKTESEEIEIIGLETCSELVAEAESRGVQLSEVILEQESRAWGKSQNEITEMVVRIMQVMKETVQNGLRGGMQSIGGLTADDGVKVQRAIKEGKLLGDPLYSKAIAYAMAVNEYNAAMGVVAAAPTGGACGALPGAILATAETLGSSDRDIVAALLTAGGIGARVAVQTSLSASVAGCQVEVGVAAGMGAAAIAQMAGAAPGQCADAAAIGIKSFIGLTCGAPGGLVEVPCVKRNGIAAVAAIASANMVLAGVQSQIPLDEVIWALANTGRCIPSKLLGTNPTGLAATPTGKLVYRRIYGEEQLKVFEEQQKVFEGGGS